MIKKWIVDQIINTPEWDTPEYWAKERKSKFRRNARQLETHYRNTTAGIIDLWTSVGQPQMPLYNMVADTTKTKMYEPKEGNYKWSIPWTQTFPTPKGY